MKIHIELMLNLSNIERKKYNYFDSVLFEICNKSCDRKQVFDTIVAKPMICHCLPSVEDGILRTGPTVYKVSCEELSNAIPLYYKTATVTNFSPEQYE